MNLADLITNRSGYDGWAVQVAGEPAMIETFSRTREQARWHRRQLEPDMFKKVRVVKVKITLEITACS